MYFMKSDNIFKSKLNFFLFLLLGFFLSFSLPPYNYIFLGFVIFPFILYLLKLNEQKNPRTFFVYGLLFAFGYFSSSLYWISYSLNFDPEVEILKPFAILILPFPCIASTAFLQIFSITHSNNVLLIFVN